jgi:hypothetical protein
MIDRAKQQYLAFLLNIASNKLLTSTVVSEDGATASQALQQVAAFINDGDPANDEVAKDISDTINNGKLVAAGVIDLDIEPIPYEEDLSIAPARTRLIGVNPSPFMGSTVLRMDLAQDVPVAVRIYSVSGRLVRDLVKEQRPAGRHEVAWDGHGNDGRAVSPGVYFVKMQADHVTQVRRVVKVR